MPRALAGTLPTTLGRLGGLRHLRVDHNLLRGTVPPELGRLTSLNLLELNDNELTGTLPETLADLEALGRDCPEWRRQCGLDVRFNNLTGCAPPIPACAPPESRGTATCAFGDGVERR